jgi:hypothetical protein
MENVGICILYVEKKSGNPAIDARNFWEEHRHERNHLPGDESRFPLRRKHSEKSLPSYEAVTASEANQVKHV